MLEAKRAKKKQDAVGAHVILDTSTSKETPIQVTPEQTPTKKTPIQQTPIEETSVKKPTHIRWTDEVCTSHTCLHLMLTDVCFTLRSTTMPSAMVSFSTPLPLRFAQPVPACL